MEIFEIRRENLRKLAQVESKTALSKRLGHKHPSFLTQLAGPNPTREITERVAREFEEKLGLMPGYLDRIDGASTPNSFADPMAAWVIDIVQLVGDIAESEQVQLSPKKFADIVVLGMNDAREHNGRARQMHIRQIVQLLK